MRWVRRGWHRYTSAFRHVPSRKLQGMCIFIYIKVYWGYIGVYIHVYRHVYKWVYRVYEDKYPAPSSVASREPQPKLLKTQNQRTGDKGSTARNRRKEPHCGGKLVPPRHTYLIRPKLQCAGDTTWWQDVLYFSASMLSSV